MSYPIPPGPLPRRCPTPIIPEPLQTATSEVEKRAWLEQKTVEELFTIMKQMQLYHFGYKDKESLVQMICNQPPGTLLQMKRVPCGHRFLRPKFYR
ncbi:hypothetical protein [Synechococcus sp. PCC 6312]|uniref:hypothetical protein n=1 Tax=Synechococcus sp. (strain ATCC 27167 / PCC 6312) TaxID=195253 RepID=UPI00029F0B82|nr:hypothetical protein [Synechococcus sp. PCC 6312]AFY60087.1 hypothetical protein Syn6312_0879 [Synechococcus sp. PCC 6312]